ncbi:MAG: betaine/proline/choline family ABC transporter ATP-binding protein [Christensenellales bacterium]|jgi:osmoprotectant transport system ATP-binding protein
MLRFENVSMAYGTQEVLRDLSFEIQEGQLAVLIGPSGCGKTTTLQLINRLINPTSGKIFIDGVDIQSGDPVMLRRNIGYVIQEIGLFPHMTIEQNIEIVPKLLKWPEEKQKKRTSELLDMVGLDPDTYLKRYPSNLSGGQQQRIGLLRALAAEPPIILMDEPFGALDPITRDSLQDEIKRLQRKLKKTIVFVTHDMDEAIKIADVIILMKDGRIVQAASPDELLSNPANEFVEQFIGKHRIYNGKVETVQDVMRSKVFMVTQNDGLAHSIAIMESKRVSTLLVVDDDDKLLGYIGIEDLINANRIGRTVRDMQLKEIPRISPHAPAKEAFDMIIKDRLDILAVVDETDQVLGVVTKTSMVTSLAHVVWREDENG